jgi:hypothetical protein
MKNHLLAITLPAGLLASMSLLTAQTDFRWSGAVAPSATVTVRGVNGDVRSTASSDALVHVEATKRARRSDPDSVRIEVVEEDGGLIVCAVYPTPPDARRENGCRNGSSNTRDNDVSVDFLIRVPAGVRFEGSTVNGDVALRGLTAEARGTTVNGDVSIRTSGFVSAATTVNGDIELDLPAGLNAAFSGSTVNGMIYSDFPVLLNGRFGPRSARGTIGSGGPELRATTVNGSITLRRR